MKTFSLSLFGLVGFASYHVVRGAQCRLCITGDEVPDSHYDKELGVEGLPVNTCGDLSTALSVLADDSGECKSAQASGSLCGCPIPPNACRLCEEGMSLAGVEINLPSYVATDYISAAPAGETMTCESMESLLHTWDQSDERCATFQNDLASNCTCVDAPAADAGAETPAETPAEPAKEQSTSSALSLVYYSTTMVVMLSGFLMAW